MSVELTSISQLIPWVSLHVPGCPDNVITDALKRRMIRFFERTHVWTHTQSDLTTVAEQPGYALTAPADGAVKRIEYVGYLDTEGNVQTYVKDCYYGFDRSSGKLEFYGQAIPQEADLDFEVKFSVIPVFRADTYPAWAVDRWGENIACGAARDLVMMPAKPWTNPNLEPYLRQQFNAALIDAARERDQQGTKRVNRLSL